MRKVLNGILAVLASSVVVGCALAAPVPERETRKVPLADGVELATEIYRPKKVPAPVILIRTPYGREGMKFLGEAFSSHGYVVAIQDVRGKYDSTGEHEPFRHERNDGLQTLKWIAEQDWCDGKIGMWGLSYSGYSALVLSDVEFEPFQSILSISGWTAVEEVVQPGGATHLMLNLPWMLTQQGRRQRGLGEYDMDALFRFTPLKDVLRSVGIRNSTWEDSAWLEAVSAREKPGKVQRPVFQVTGWYDMVYRATLDAWNRMSHGATAPQKLAIGPWHHDQMFFETWDVGDAQFGEASGFGTGETIALSLRWFDATLRGRENGILEEPPVSFFLMGQNTWHHSKAWPPANSEVKERRWYLDSGGQANGSAGDGTLAPSKPRGAGADHFVFDPLNPVPTLGGANFFYFPELVGVRDQREIERRDDVLVYTSAPLTKPIQITGKVSVHLEVATTGKATDFTAKLVVVRPDGYAGIVEDGIVRLDADDSQARAADAPFPITIDVGQTAIHVPVGHRLRLEISSSNFPKYDRNPNTGVNPFEASEFRDARQTVFHSADHRSYLVLPTRRSPLVDSVAARQPLVSPLPSEGVAVAKVTGDDFASLLAAGQTQLDAEDSDQAIATLRRAVEVDPEQPKGHLLLGRAYLQKLQTSSMFKKLGLSKKVRASYLEAVRLEPDSVDARTSLANFYFQAPSVAGGSFEKGREQAAEIKKRDARAAHLLMAGAYSNRKEYDEAKAEYRSVLALDPQATRVYYALGLLYQNERSWEAAFEAFESGARMDDDVASLYQMGRTAVFSGAHLDRGKAAMEKYIELAPEKPMPSVAAARWRLGMIYEHLDQKDLARLEYETALKLEPDLEQARDALETLRSSK